MKFYRSLSAFLFSALLFSSTLSFGARNGTPVAGHFPGVALIKGGGLTGTGVLISENLVLTVNHVLGKGTPETLKVYFDYMPGYENRPQKVEDFRIFSQDIFQEIVLIKLAEPAPVHFYPLYANAILPKTTLFGVGYGMTLNPDIKNNTLNQAEMIFRRYSPLGELLPGPDNQLGCPGDSGGPIFLIGSDREPRVVGLAGHIIGKFKDTDTNAIACQNANLVRFIPIKDHIDWIYLAARGMGAPIK